MKRITVKFESKEYYFPYYYDLDSQEITFVNKPSIHKLVHTKSRNGNKFIKRLRIFDNSIIENVVRLGKEKLDMRTKYNNDEITPEDYKSFLKGAN